MNRNKGTFYHGAVKQQRIKCERYTFILAKPHSGPTNSLGRVERSIPASKNCDREYRHRKSLEYNGTISPTYPNIGKSAGKRIRRSKNITHREEYLRTKEIR